MTIIAMAAITIKTGTIKTGTIKTGTIMRIMTTRMTSLWPISTMARKAIISIIST